MTGVDGLSYLFTGDTAFLGEDHVWRAGFIPDISDADALTASLKVLSTLAPELVVSSAFAGDAGARLLGDTPWSSCVEQAISTLPA